VQPADGSPSVKLYEEILETRGERKALTRDLSPLWGLAASLLLTATLFGVMLISAPPNELRQMADQKVWNVMGVTGLRQLLSDWTNGSWPINSAGSIQPNDPLEINAHTSPQQIVRSGPDAAETPQ